MTTQGVHASAEDMWGRNIQLALRRQLVIKLINNLLLLRVGKGNGYPDYKSQVCEKCCC